MIEDVDNNDFLNIIIEAFLSGMPSRLGSLRSALARGDTNAVYGYAMSMKSAGAFIGIDRFTGLCRKLETSVRAGGSAGAIELISEIESEYVRLEPDLQRRVGRSKRTKK